MPETLHRSAVGRAAATILLVEDDPAAAEALVELLESDGYRVWHASDGAGAEDLLGEARPDLVLLDIRLPDVDGLVLCYWLRAHCPAPIILLSATSRESDPILGRRLGAVDFIAKPFEAQDLLDRLGAALRRPAGRRHPVSAPTSTGAPAGPARARRAG